LDESHQEFKVNKIRGRALKIKIKKDDEREQFLMNSPAEREHLKSIKNKDYL